MPRLKRIKMDRNKKIVGELTALNLQRHNFDLLTAEKLFVI